MQFAPYLWAVTVDCGPSARRPQAPCSAGPLGGRITGGPHEPHLARLARAPLHCMTGRDVEPAAFGLSAVELQAGIYAPERVVRRDTDDVAGRVADGERDCLQPPVDGDRPRGNAHFTRLHGRPLHHPATLT